MRIAWIGPGPRSDGGVPGVAALVLAGLAHAGAEVDCFCAERREEIPESLLELPGIRWMLRPPPWRWDAWYSATPATAFLTRQVATSISRVRLGHSLVERHGHRRYDVAYQFSSMELLGLRRSLDELPPLVLHPQVHAAGELDALRAERRWARRLEPLPKRALVAANLAVRARSQARDAESAALLLAPSERFASRLERDYRLAPGRLRALPNPIDLEHFRPGAERARSGRGPVSLRFASYLAARKGCELVVALSHRLADLAGRVRILVAGQGRMWSDYTALMAQLHPAVGEFVGWIPHERMPTWYRDADAVLVPSHYEPFALTVAEALACGTPVVAGDSVGATEWVRGPACLTFRSGDLDAFEAAVRALLRTEDPAELRRLARATAERAFSRLAIVPSLLDALADAARID